MSYQLEYVRQGLCVQGYDLDPPWLAVSASESVENFDVFGPEGQERAWVMIGSDPDKRLVLLDIPRRRRLGVIKVGHPSPRAIPSRDGHHIYVLSNGKVSDGNYPSDVVLLIIDVATARVSAMRKVSGIALASFGGDAVLMPDGGLRFSATAEGVEGLATIDASSGQCAFDPLPGEVRKLHIGQTWLSPSGRFALRPNLASMPLHTGPDGRLWYGVTLQLWETSPLRYLRTLTCAWLEETELPQFNLPPAPTLLDNLCDRVITTSIAGALTSALVRRFGAVISQTANEWRRDLMSRADATRKERNAVTRMEPPLRQIARALSEHPKESLVPPPLTADRIPRDPLRKPIVEAHWAFSQLVSDFRWQPDESAFWCQVYKFWICVGLDGRASARIRLARFGMDGSLIMQRANGPSRVEALDGRKARFTYAPPYAGANYSAGIIDGAPAERPWEIQVIPEDADGLAPLPFEPHISGIVMEVAGQVGDMHVLRVPLASRKRGACIRAIEALTDTLANCALQCSYECELAFAFELPDGKLIDSKRFFGLVEKHGLPTVPALRRLLETFLALPSAEVWAKRGTCIMPAVNALASLDSDALLVQRYPH